MKHFLFILFCLLSLVNYAQEDDEEEFDDDPIEDTGIYETHFLWPCPPNGNAFLFFDEYIIPRIDSEVLAKADTGFFEIEFTVLTDGSVADVKILSSVDEALDEEVIRIIRSSVWKPGGRYGEVADVRLIIDYYFDH